MEVCTSIYANAKLKSVKLIFRSITTNRDVFTQAKIVSIMIQEMGIFECSHPAFVPDLIKNSCSHTYFYIAFILRCSRLLGASVDCVETRLYLEKDSMLYVIINVDRLTDDAFCFSSPFTRIPPSLGSGGISVYRMIRKLCGEFYCVAQAFNSKPCKSISQMFFMC